jgi:exopolysaccharide biosynthesis polyprenyl glycosylphosphotransferase
MISNQPKFKYIFLSLDIIILAISFFFAKFSVQHTILDELIPGIVFFSVYLITFIIIPVYLFYYNGLYKRNNILSVYRQIILILKSLLISAVFLAFIMFIYYQFDLRILYRKNIFLYSFTFSFLLFIILRVTVARKMLLLLLKRRIFQSKVIIIGTGDAGIRVGKALENSKYLDFKIIGYIGEKKSIKTDDLNNYNYLGSFSNIEKVINKYEVDEILIAIDNINYDTMISIVQRCLEFDKVVRIYSNFLKTLEEKLNVELYAGIPVIMLSQYSLSGKAWKIKRIIDIIFSGIALIALLPFFIITAVGIKVSSSGPVFYIQKRIGKDGKPINFYKFRSMHIAKSDEGHKKFVQNFIKDKSGNKDIRIFKITDDPRIFKFGKFIRKTSIDELPQLYSVLKGDMSLIGPRPCLPYEWEVYSDWHKKRLHAIPGCTGLWQVVGRSMVSFEEMVLLDLYYISNMSIWFDFKIIIKTFPVLFLGKGGF